MIPELLSLGAQVYGMGQSSEAQEEQEDYQREQQKKADREARRQALGRAIGATDNYMPKKEEPAPDMSSYALKKGIADMITYSLNDYLANPEKYNAMFAGQPYQGVGGSPTAQNNWAGGNPSNPYEA